MDSIESCNLAERDCVPCRGGVPPLSSQESAHLMTQLDGWEVIQNHHLSKTYTFPDFASALAFVNRIGVLAEQNTHHPDLYLSWGMVRIELYTHKIDGLSESDFILAAKCDAIPRT